MHGCGWDRAQWGAARERSSALAAPASLRGSRASPRVTRSALMAWALCAPGRPCSSRVTASRRFTQGRV